MRRATTSGAATQRQGRYQKWPPGTKWAYFKTIPDSVGGPGTPKHGGSGWVRVGSKLWGEIKYYNAHASGQTTPGSAHGGRVTRGAHEQLIPSRKATQAWNPASPKGQTLLNGDNNGNPNSPENQNPDAPNNQDPNHRPGSRTTRTTTTNNNPPKDQGNVYSKA